MALTWSVKNVANHDEVTTWIPSEDDPNGRFKAGDRLWNPVTEALVWASLSTGIGTITEANAAEVYARIHLVEKLFGAMLIRAEVDGVRPSGEAAFITADEVISHIGLSTNASFKDETRPRFLKRQAGSFLDDGARRFERHLAKAKEQAA